MDTFSQYARQLSVHTSTYRGKLALLTLLQFQSKYDVLPKHSPVIATFFAAPPTKPGQNYSGEHRASSGVPNGDVNLLLFFFSGKRICCAKSNKRV